MIGKVVGDYRILEKRGEGGMGMFFKAQDIRLDRLVGLKTIRAELLHDPEVLAKLGEEAKSLARLDHPNIARLLHYMVVDEQHYIVMEYVEGLDLAERLRRDGALPLGEMAHILPQICSAIGYAHSRNVIHRDIKPSNLLLTADGTIKVTDFGIAKILGVSAQTKTGVATGSLPYMAPEQIRGGTIDARTDIYQLGITLFELLTGRRPFIADTEYDMMSHHLATPPPRPSAAVSRIPAAVDQLIETALAKDPNARFATAAEMAAQFRSAVGGSTSGAVSDRTDYRAPVPPHKPRNRWLSIGIPVLAAIAAVALVVRLMTREPGPALPTGTNSQLSGAMKLVAVEVHGTIPDGIVPEPSWQRTWHIEYLRPGEYSVIFEGGALGITNGPGDRVGQSRPGDTSHTIQFFTRVQASDSIRFTMRVTSGDSLVICEGERVASILPDAESPVVEIPLSKSGRRMQMPKPRPDPIYVRALVGSQLLDEELRSLVHHWRCEVKYEGGGTGRAKIEGVRTSQTLSARTLEWAPLTTSPRVQDTAYFEPGDSIRISIRGYNALGQKVALGQSLVNVDSGAISPEFTVRVAPEAGSRTESIARDVNLTIDVQPITDRGQVSGMWVDGKKVSGALPLEQNLSAGLHLVRWQIGDDIWTDTVTTGRDPTTKYLKYESSRGRINVVADFPDGQGSAQIWRDGQDTQQGTPAELRDVASGPHQVDLRIAGFKQRGGPFIVIVPANGRARVRIEMVRD